MQTSAHVSPTRTAVPPDPLADFRRELMNWAEPVIADRILDGYRSLQLAPEITRVLSGQHRRLWRAILLDRRGVMDDLRQELLQDLANADVDSDLADGIDQSVVEELIDIVLKRFRFSGERVKGFSMILLGAASHLSPSQGVMYS